MESQEFTNIRTKLNKTQKEMSQLLGTSIKAVHSYEQGWRSIPAHVERQMFYLAFHRLVKPTRPKSCWQVARCPKNRRDRCPAREFKMYKLCWFVCGTLCQGVVHRTWQEKMTACRKCPVFQPLLKAASSHE